MSQRNLVAAVGAWFVVVAVAQAAAFQNGSFENPQLTGAAALDFAIPGFPVVSVPGWTSTSNGSTSSQNFIYGLSTTGYSDGVSNGQQAILMNGDGSVTTTLTQTFDTTSGAGYVVLFDLGIQSSAATGTTAPISLQASGNSLANYTVTAVGPTGTIDPFTTESYSFVATSNSTTLTFTQVGGGGDSPLLDNVRVVPEPGSLCLLALGGIALAAIGRRSHKNRQALLRDQSPHARPTICAI